MTEMPGVAEQTAPAAARWEDLIDIIFSPAAVFRRRADESWKPTFLLLVGVSVVLYYVLFPVQQIVARAQLTDPAQLQAYEQYGRMFSLVGGIIIVPVGIAVVLLATAAWLWILARLVEVRLAFNRMFLITALTALLGPLAQLVTSAVVFLKRNGDLHPKHDLSIGVLPFLDPAAVPDTLVPVLARVAVFPIWQAVLWGVGIAIFARATKAQAAIVAGVAWITAAAPQVVFALLRG